MRFLTVANHLCHEWGEILLNSDAHPDLGAHPWNFTPPLILDTQASTALGYQPAGRVAQRDPAEYLSALDDPSVGATGRLLSQSFQPRLETVRGLDVVVRQQPEAVLVKTRPPLGVCLEPSSAQT
ncbi:hypothetical protein [Arthrobacter sp. C9C5]|uniref:hypothetical protein n=1 Tax=Arthrobacter sp. C9C5 TaxID=2735267 RepID=UPI0015855740|nr:hypothetical protein [Arthrobacter sp. C9C5]NUU32194.1 hypothetical protein [Arthrobacter sp. C9C5]